MAITTAFSETKNGSLFFTFTFTSLHFTSLFTHNAFNFTKEIPLKMNRTKKKRFTKKLKSPSFLKRKSLWNIFTFNFTKEIPLNFKSEITLNFMKKIPLKICNLQFYMKIPFKIILTHLQFYKRNPFKFFEKKKLTLKFGLKNTL